MYIQFRDHQELELTLMHQNDMSFIGIWAPDPDFLMLTLKVYKEVAFILWFPFPDCLHFPSFFPLACTERIRLECLRSHCTCLLMIQSPFSILANSLQSRFFGLVSCCPSPKADIRRVWSHLHTCSYGHMFFCLNINRDGVVLTDVHRVPHCSVKLTGAAVNQSDICSQKQHLPCFHPSLRLCDTSLTNITDHPSCVCVPWGQLQPVAGLLTLKV